MVIGRGENSESGDQVLLLGLSAENMRRLVGGEPIRLTRRSHGDGVPDGWEINIVFGQTEKDIYNAHKAAGQVGENTQIFKDRRLGQ